MIATTAQENQIISQIMNIVFGADIDACEIKGLQVEGETVVVITSFALYSLGRDYFRQLVKQIKAEKAETVVAEAEVQVEVETAIVALGQSIESTANNKQGSHTKMEKPTMSVRIMYRNNWFGGDGWTYFPVTVEISTKCPVCGGERGTPHPYNFHEDGDWITVDVWENPCGHKDLYPDVLREAGYRH